MLIGCADGVLRVVKWPYYSQDDLYLKDEKKIYICDEEIVGIEMDLFMSELYVVSRSGTVVVCEFVVGGAQV